MGVIAAGMFALPLFNTSIFTVTIDGIRETIADLRAEIQSICRALLEIHKRVVLNGICTPFFIRDSQ
jgi:hypothetical protein